MGLRIERERFDARDRERFQRRLARSLDVLRELLGAQGFGGYESSLGAEIELSLIDAEARALPLNREVLKGTVDPQLQLELDRFNLEYNLSPVRLRGRPFSTLHAELVDALDRIDVAARKFGGAVICVGILPTLRELDLDRHAMTDLPRYRALSRAIVGLRKGRGKLRIDGPDPLVTAIDDVTMEGAATSLQLHLRVPAAEFARYYNAAQAAVAPALAIAGNSPLFLAHRLWTETRIALFRQAVGTDADPYVGFRLPSRVGFGHGWLRRDAFELFAETVALFPPLIPLCDPLEPEAAIQSGRAPVLPELRLHMSTVWRWNRPVYDPVDGGHLRIEMRALPSGPTPTDSAANAAFLIGLTLGLAADVDALLWSFPFRNAHDNFYRAAQFGYDAQLVWPLLQEAPSLAQLPAATLCEHLLPVARRGLLAHGIDGVEADRWLGVVEARIQRRSCGSRWQLETLARLEPRLGRDAALVELTRRYRALAESRAPVHMWEVDD